MTAHCAGVVEAFEDAITAVQQRIGTEDLEVPENDWRGDPRPRQWGCRHHNR